MGGWTNDKTGHVMLFGGVGKGCGDPLPLGSFPPLFAGKEEERLQKRSNVGGVSCDHESNIETRARRVIS